MNPFPLNGVTTHLSLSVRLRASLLFILALLLAATAQAGPRPGCSDTPLSAPEHVKKAQQARDSGDYATAADEYWNAWCKGDLRSGS